MVSLLHMTSFLKLSLNAMNNTFRYPIESLSSLHNLTISFLSSNDVTDFFAMFTIQEPVKSRCNLVKYPILYSYPRKFFNNTNNY